MRIANNILSMTVYRMYNLNLQSMQKSMERLASGYRINRAADDPAGLAISEKMRAQIRGLNMATKNSQDGVSLIQTAEGALDQVHSILQRMNELAVQSATGTNQNLDRNALAQEFNQLREEINDIAKQATFNDMNLFDGSLMGKKGGTAGAVGVSGSDITGAVVSGEFNVSQTGNYSLEATDDGVKVIRDALEVGNYSWADLGIDPGSVVAGAVSIGLPNGASLDFNVATTDFGDLKNALNSVKFSVENTAKGAYKDVGLVMQVGAREGDTLAVSIQELSSKLLKLDELDISTQEGAGKAITGTRTAINNVSGQRAYLGAVQNRLEYKISNLTNSALNLSEAESRIRDVDYALEMSNFIKKSIQMQAAMAMLAQTNTLAQNVLHLLQSA